MTAVGRLHLAATLGLLIALAMAPLADAGVYQTPAGGWGIDRPVTPPVTPTGNGRGARAGDTSGGGN